MNYKVVNCKTLRIRKKPDYDSEILDRIKVGTIVEVTTKRLGWAHTKDGWCRLEFLEQCH